MATATERKAAERLKKREAVQFALQQARSIALASFLRRRGRTSQLVGRRCGKEDWMRNLGEFSPLTLASSCPEVP